MKPYRAVATIGGAGVTTLGGLAPRSGVIKGVRSNQWSETVENRS